MTWPRCSMRYSCAQRLSALDLASLSLSRHLHQHHHVLNASRHWISLRDNNKASQVELGLCSTPLGIGSRLARSSSPSGSGPPSAQRLLALDLASQGVTLLIEIQKLCSTPLGIGSRFAPDPDAAKIVIKWCSTPLGIGSRFAR